MLPRSDVVRHTKPELLTVAFADERKIQQHMCNVVRYRRNTPLLRFPRFLWNEAGIPSRVSIIANQFGFAKFRRVRNPHTSPTHQFNNGTEAPGVECFR